MPQGFYPALEQTFSKPRLHSYRDGDVAATNLEVTARYVHNMFVAMRLSPSLHILEVSLRNNMHHAFSHRYQTVDWFDTPGLLGPRQLGQVAAARSNLASASKAATADRIVAELTMGFWVGLFGGYYELHWRSNPALLKAIFPSAPRYLRRRNAISALLQPLRALRNRVSHWERVAHLPDLLRLKQDIGNVVRSLCPAASCLLSHCDPFDGALSLEELAAVRATVQPCFEFMEAHRHHTGCNQAPDAQIR